ncbi:MAG TPA: DoxX family protein [Acidimicrobiia bacterium]|nr:DoxX family protein [Acidimicrobiia bacterium]
MDIGLLILRIVFGALLIGHGGQKLFGWFGGHGLDGVAGFFHSLGFRPGRPMAAVAGGSEVLGGLLLGFGLLSPLAGAMIIGTMLVAASVHADKGLWGANGGYELPLLYAVAAGAVSVSGAGSLSLDHLLGIDEASSAPLGVVAIAVGLVTGAAVIVRARGLLAAEGAEVAEPSVSHADPAAA